MFDFLFGWRKASKCKNLIRRVQCRLKLLKSKRCTIVRQLREDVAELIKSGYEEIAIDRAEQLFKDESIVSVYELLDNFCEFIIIHMPYIRRNRDCPNDINEAVSSLIFASARCGDLPELRMIRKLFGERYGERFATTAVELHPGNLVNSQIKEKLSIKSVSDEVKLRMVNDIAKDYCLRPEILALEYTPEFHKQAQRKENHKQLRILAQVDPSNAQDLCKDAVVNDSNVAGHELSVDPSNSHTNFSHGEAIFSLQCSTRILGMLMQRKHGDKVNYGHMTSPYALAITNTDPEEHDNAAIGQKLLEQKEEITAVSSSQGSPKISEEKVVYLDDVEEVESPIKDGDDQDQRVFKFKPSLTSWIEISEDSLEQGYVDQSDSWDENSASKSFGKSKKTWSSGKRIRRRSVSRERSSVEDIDCLVYYNEPSKKPTYHRHRPSCCQFKHPKSNPVEGNETSFGLDQKLKQPCCINSGDSFRVSKCVHVSPKACPDCCINCKMNAFSLESPYNMEDPLEKRKDGIRTSVSGKQEAIQDHSISIDAKNTKSSDAGSTHVAMPEPKPKPSCAKVDTMYGVSTYPNPSDIKRLESEYDSSSSQTSTNASASVYHPPCSRAITMPPLRPREDDLEKIPRSYSCAFQHPNHVHPKLPDYDDIAAKFLALKKEHLQARILGNARQVR